MSRGHTGPRVVKPRTDKQRAAADRYKGRAPQGPWIVPPASPGPVTSWWIGASRDELQEKAREEQARMAWSKFGRLLGSGASE
jgi:hypothetical protein